MTVSNILIKLRKQHACCVSKRRSGCWMPADPPWGGGPPRKTSAPSRGQPRLIPMPGSWRLQPAV